MQYLRRPVMRSRAPGASFSPSSTLLYLCLAPSCVLDCHCLIPAACDVMSPSATCTTLGALTALPTDAAVCCHRTSSGVMSPQQRACCAVQGWNRICSNPGPWMGTLQRLSAVPDLPRHHGGARHGLLHPLLDLCNGLCHARFPACKPLSLHTTLQQCSPAGYTMGALIFPIT